MNTNKYVLTFAVHYVEWIFFFFLFSGRIELFLKLIHVNKIFKLIVRLNVDVVCFNSFYFVFYTD